MQAGEVDGLLKLISKQLDDLDDDRTLQTLASVYPALLSAFERLEAIDAADDVPPTAAAAFVEAERVRLAEGRGPPWRIEHVMVGVGCPDEAPANAYAMTLALVDRGPVQEDLRDLLRFWLDRHRVPTRK